MVTVTVSPLIDTVPVPRPHRGTPAPPGAHGPGRPSRQPLDRRRTVRCLRCRPRRLPGHVLGALQSVQLAGQVDGDAHEHDHDGRAEHEEHAHRPPVAAVMLGHRAPPVHMRGATGMCVPGVLCDTCPEKILVVGHRRSSRVDRTRTLGGAGRVAGLSAVRDSLFHRPPPATSSASDRPESAFMAMSGSSRRSVARALAVALVLLLVLGATGVLLTRRTGQPDAPPRRPRRPLRSRLTGPTQPPTPPTHGFTTRSSTGRAAGTGSTAPRLTVPVDWDAPDGETIELAMIRLPAGGSKIGSLFRNPGGPGVPWRRLPAHGGGVRRTGDPAGLRPRRLGHPGYRRVGPADLSARQQARRLLRGGLNPGHPRRGEGVHRGLDRVRAGVPDEL